MIDLAGNTLLGLPAKLGRPWHGLVRNNADVLAATLTLGNGATRAWSGPVNSGDAWLLRRPTVACRLIADVYETTPGEFPPPDAPDWPLTTAAETAAGMRYLDHSLQPWGTGAQGWPIAFAADLTPWMIGINVAVVSGEIVYQMFAKPYGRLGAAPIDWVAMSPAGTDRLATAPYLPPAEHLGNGPLAPDYAHLLSVSEDGRRWLMGVTDPESGTLLGIYEVRMSGGSATEPPVFALHHYAAWTDVCGVYGATVGYAGLTVHAWYDELDEIRPITLEKAHDPAAGGIRGTLTWTLLDGTRALSTASVNLNATVALNGQFMPGSIAGEYAVLPAPHANDDARTRHRLTAVLHTSTTSREFGLGLGYQSQSLIGLRAYAANSAGDQIDGIVWLGVGSPQSVDATLVADTATIISIAGGVITFAADHSFGAVQPKTGQIIRNQSERVAFV